MAEDLKQLAALSASPAETPLPAAARGAAPGADAVDRLTTWLLSQGDLQGIA